MDSIIGKVKDHLPGARPAPGSAGIPAGIDLAAAQRYAESHHHHGGSDLFATALKQLSATADPAIDEREFVRSHQAVYGGGAQAGSHSLAQAAAMQALKTVVGSRGADADQNKLIGVAMSEAAKLADSRGALVSAHAQTRPRGDSD